MKRLSLFVFFCIAQLAVFAQGLELKNKSLIFDPCNELSSKTGSFTIYNTSETTIRIKNIIGYKTYLQNVFSLIINPSDSSISPGDSLTLTAVFSPIHNIYHNSEILVITEPNAYSFSVDLQGQGIYSNTYYANTQNLSEESLKAALKTITGQGYVSLGYTPARNYMFMNIDNKKANGQGAAQNTLECVYTGREAIGYTDRTDAQNSHTFDTEHTFPQGFFSQNEPMRSDLHHLFPTYSPANNSRGNFPFGIATQPYKNDDRNYPSHLGTNNVYEPHDAQKGTTARAMMYFVIRYTDYSNFFAPQENILRSWHNQFLPDSIEEKRNTDIAFYQKNRNPFVDYPQFTERIQKLVGTSNAPISISLEMIDSVSFGTISASDTSFYLNIPIVNTGTGNILLSNFQSADTNIYFLIQGNMDTLLHAGEAYHLQIALNRKSAGNIHSSINFNTSIGAKTILIDGSITGVSGLAFGEKINLKIYPNPSNGYYRMNSNVRLDERHFQVYNIFGRVQPIHLHRVNERSYILDISHLEDGIYLLRHKHTAYRLLKK